MHIYCLLASVYVHRWNTVPWQPIHDHELFMAYYTFKQDIDKYICIISIIWSIWDAVERLVRHLILGNVINLSIHEVEMMKWAIIRFLTFARGLHLVFNWYVADCSLCHTIHLPFWGEFLSSICCVICWSLYNDKLWELGHLKSRGHF